MKVILTFTEMETILRALNLMEAECKELLRDYEKPDSMTSFATVSNARHDLESIAMARLSIKDYKEFIK